jgi:hydroxyacylglutathione hydrolase
LGYERRNNPSLQMDRDAFVQYKVNENHYQPPYFRKMEEFNLKGNAPVLDELPKPAPMSPSAFEAAMEDGMLALDVRSPEANAGALVPGSLAIPLNMLPAFAGWYVDYDRPIGLIVRYEQYDHAEEAVRMLARLGYDNIAGFLDEGLHGWETSGKRYDRIGTLHAAELTAWITSGKDFTLLDVRSLDEYESGRLEGARHIYAGKLPDHVDELPRGKPVVTFCGSGRRAVIAASVLKQHGFEEVYDCLGSMSACSTVGCPLEGAA